MYFTYKLLLRTLDTDLKFIYTFLLYTIVVFVVLIRLLLLHEINHYLFVYLFILFINDLLCVE